MNILVIDQQDWLSPLVAQSHYDVVWVEDEVQAYHLTQHQHPNLIFLSYQLKKHETPGFVALLLSACPAAKVVILDQQLDEDRLMECLVAGAQGYQDRDSMAHYAQRLILAMNAGEAWLTRKMVAKLLNVIRAMVQVSPEHFVAEVAQSA